jgi:general stress protein CsbA
VTRKELVLFPELIAVKYVAMVLRQRLADARHDERGMTTETVIITAILAALALAVGAIIVYKVTTKANNIPTGG